jgi:hypothetical protein
VVFLLSKLEKLQLPEAVFLSMDLEECERHGLDVRVLGKAPRNRMLRGAYAHVVYFYGMMVGCVRSKEAEVRDRVAGMFEIVNTLVVDM